MTAEKFFDNFGHLADAPNGVKKLRKLILQLAVQGKLVPQDSNNEPVMNLVEESQRRKKNPLPAIAEVEKPFNLPLGWKWVDLESWDNGQQDPVSQKNSKVIKISHCCFVRLAT